MPTLNYCLKSCACWLSSLQGPVIHMRTRVRGCPRIQFAERVRKKRERLQTHRGQGTMLNCQRHFQFLRLDLNESRQEAEALGNSRKASAICTPWMTLAFPSSQSHRRRIKTERNSPALKTRATSQKTK